MRPEIKPFPSNRQEKFFDYRGVRFKTITDDPLYAGDKPREWVYIYLWPGTNCTFTAQTMMKEANDALSSIDTALEHVRRIEERVYDDEPDMQQWQRPNVRFEVGHDFQHSWDYDNWRMDGATQGESGLLNFATTVIDQLIDAGICYEKPQEHNDGTI